MLGVLLIDHAEAVQMRCPQQALGVEDVEAVRVISVHRRVQHVVAAGRHHAQAILKALPRVEDVLDAADIDERAVTVVLAFRHRVIHVVVQFRTRVEKIQRKPRASPAVAKYSPRSTY